jgi:hypothetical protein
MADKEQLRTPAQGLMSSEWARSPHFVLITGRDFPGLQAIDEFGEQPNRSEIIGSVIVVTDLNIEPLLAKYAQLQKTD